MTATSSTDDARASVPDPVLPEGIGIRAAGADDVPAMFALLSAEQLASAGESSLSQDEVADWFETPRGRERNDVRILERDGTPVAVWQLFRNFDDKYWAQVAVDRALPSGLVDELWRAGLDWTERLTLAIAAVLGVTAPRLDLWVNEHDALTRKHAEASGFQQMRAFIEMQIDLAGYAAPAPTAGVTVRQAEIPDADSPDLEIMYRLITESFRDHYDFQLRTFDDWRESRSSDALLDRSHWYVAEIDGEPVGGLIGDNSYLEADDAGYIANLGVLRQGRGRGVAKALLHTSFARYAADGRAAVKLHVDAESPTGATHLYEAVGMYRRLVGFDFHKRLGSGD